MSIFGNVLKRSSQEYSGTLDVYDDFWYTSIGGPSKSGQTVSKASAMRLKMVYACISRISSSISGLPLKLIRPKAGGGTEPVTDHPLYDLCKNVPNPKQTSKKWREYKTAQVLACGNAFSWIEKDKRGVRGLWPLDPDTVRVREATKEELAVFGLSWRDNIVYEVVFKSKKSVFPARDILHIMGFGGMYMGESVITNYARETIGIGQSMDEFLGAFFKNGVHTNGVFEHPTNLGKNKDAFITALDQRYGGSSKAYRPMVLENGMKFSQLQVSLADQQFLEQMRFNDLGICSIFHVPPSKVGIECNQTSYNNTEQENKSYVVDCLLDWAISWEQALNSRLLTDQERKAGYQFKHNFAALLRPDALTCAQIAQIEWAMGIPVNVYLEREDRNPVEFGDTPMAPMNFIPMDQATNPEEPIEGNSIRMLPTEERKRKDQISIRNRDRIKRIWSPIIKRTADRVVRIETRAVKREAEKNLKERAQRDFSQFLDEFYGKFPETIKAEFGPVMRGYMEAVRDEISNQVGTDMLPAKFDELINSYVDGFVRQYIDASRGQLIELINENEDFAEPVITRADEWEEKRSGKIEMDQSVSIGEAVVAAAILYAGMKMTWNIRGPSTCPYCTKLAGKKIRSGFFVKGGDNLEPDGQTPMVVKNNTLHPPLHQGCDCYLTPG